MDPFIQRYRNKPNKTYVVHSMQEYDSRVNELPKTNFKIFHVSIRSLSKNLDELKLFIAQFNESFDVIVLGETFKIHDVALFGMEGYNMLYSESEVNKNDGVVVYVREDLRCECRFVLVDKMKIMNVIFAEGGKTFVITPIYRPYETSPIEFVNGLDSFLSDQKYECDYHVIVGDTNVDILLENKNSQEYLNVLYCMKTVFSHL